MVVVELAVTKVGSLCCVLVIVGVVVTGGGGGGLPLVVGRCVDC